MKINEIVPTFELYLDSDGVFADFELGVAEMAGKPFNSVTRSHMFRLISSTYKHRKEIGSVSWWEDLALMPGAEELWNAVKDYNPTVLTGIIVSDPSSVPGKKAWWYKHFGVPEDKVICVPRVDKIKWSGPGHVLIDDTAENCSAWESVGGIAILHTDANKTIAEFHKVLKSLKI